MDIGLTQTCRACGDAGPSSAHTEQKERRKQCERPRCRARRHDAMRAAARGGRSRDAGSEHAVLSRRRHPSPSRDW